MFIIKRKKIVDLNIFHFMMIIIVKDFMILIIKSKKFVSPPSFFPLLFRKNKNEIYNTDIINY